MAELKPEDWEELEETINREKELYTASDLEAARKEEREKWNTIINSIISSCDNPEEISRFAKEAISKMGDDNADAD